MISMPKFKPCRAIENDDSRKQLLFKRIGNDSADLLKKVQSLDKSIEISESEVEIGYENLNMVEALRTILLTKDKKFTEKEIPSGFETVGDIAHMNFSQMQYPYRF